LHFNYEYGRRKANMNEVPEGYPRIVGYAGGNVFDEAL
jgi:hypothetical protein